MKKLLGIFVVLFSAVLCLSACDFSALSGTGTNTNTPCQHTAMSEWQTITKPTCTEDGLRKQVCLSASCNYSLSEPIPTPGHDFGDATLITAPTCTTAGVKHSVCKICNHVETTDIPALGHTETTIAAVPATCTTAGATEGKYCSVCNEVITAPNYTAALRHEYSEWTSAGEDAKRRECEVCGHSELRNEIIPGDNVDDGGWV